jgi:hypothetical protein
MTLNEGVSVECSELVRRLVYSVEEEIKIQSKKYKIQSKKQESSGRRTRTEAV